MARVTVATRTSVERAFLVGVGITGRKQGSVSADESLDELARLVGTVDAKVVGRMVQLLKAPSRNFYIGKGKLEELIKQKEQTPYDVVIFDDELSPGQQRNLEKALEVKVIDRVALILDVFARRAKTHEGQIQVELAQHQYLLPRLAGQWSHLERLGGGIGTRGPGESQIETDRRLIRQRIHRLKEQIDKVSQQRGLYRQRRRKSGIPVVALVGYTNAGKSTLLNALSRSEVASRNQLFTTLDPTTRKLSLPGGGKALLSDTVGFIRKLPLAIVSAFRATLEELNDSALLLHVVDITSPNAAAESETVEKILGELKLLDKPRITVLNKIDRLLESKDIDEATAMQRLAETGIVDGEGTVLISASVGWGLPKLLEAIRRAVPESVGDSTKH